MMESTYLALEFMSHNRGGRGGTVINVASMGGRLYPNTALYQVYCDAILHMQGFFLCPLPPITVLVSMALLGSPAA